MPDNCYIGNTKITNVYLGNKVIEKAYLGNKLLFDNSFEVWSVDKSFPNYFSFFPTFPFDWLTYTQEWMKKGFDKYLPEPDVKEDWWKILEILRFEKGRLTSKLDDYTTKPFYIKSADLILKDNKIDSVIVKINVEIINENYKNAKFKGDCKFSNSILTLKFERMIDLKRLRDINKDNVDECTTDINEMDTRNNDELFLSMLFNNHIFPYMVCKIIIENNGLEESFYIYLNGY